MKDIPKERTVKANVWTAAFTLTPEQIRFIADESSRRRISKSEYVRELVDAAMQDKEAA